MSKLGVRRSGVPCPTSSHCSAGPRLTAPAVQDLHVVRAQCSSSTLVTKVKVLERAFENDSAVEFQMYDAAPAAPPVPLPYFVMPDGATASDEKAVALYLARNGAPGMAAGDTVQSEAVEAVLDALPAVARAIKAATKAKDEEVLAPMPHNRACASTCASATSGG